MISQKKKKVPVLTHISLKKTSHMEKVHIQIFAASRPHLLQMLGLFWPPDWKAAVCTHGKFWLVWVFFLYSSWQTPHWLCTHSLLS